jgi:hypothetical protein
METEKMIILALEPGTYREPINGDFDLVLGLDFVVRTTLPAMNDDISHLAGVHDSKNKTARTTGIIIGTTQIDGGVGIRGINDSPLASGRLGNNP